MLTLLVGEDCHSVVTLEGADLLPGIRRGQHLRQLQRDSCGECYQDKKGSGSSTLFLHSRLQAPRGHPQDDLPTSGWLERGNPLPGSMSELAPDKRCLLLTARPTL